MDSRTFHGTIRPGDIAAALIAEFNQGNLQAQRVGRAEHLVVQIASRALPASGGRTAITVNISEVEDGVHIQLGQQQWFGVAASMGTTALAALRNPFSLLGRLDDLAEDIASLQLSERIWEAVERAAGNMGASFEISARLRRLTCAYCTTANPVGEPSCVACGAPLGRSQPVACLHCGYVVEASVARCPSCQHPIL